MVLVAAAFAAAAATNDLDVARQALRDGLWEVARSHALKDGSDTAKLVVLESLAGEGKWKDVASRLNEWKSARGGAFDYYRAIVKGDHAAAMELLRKGGSPEGCREADLFEAETLAKSGKRDEAEKLWRALVADTNAGCRVFALASVGLGEVPLLRRAYEMSDIAKLRRMTGLRLGTALLRAKETAAEGETLVRTIVKDSPDADGAREAFLAVADFLLADGQHKKAFDAFREAIEIWPDLAKVSSVQEGRGWALRKLNRTEEALDAFRRAGELAADDETRARALVAEGDLYLESGKEDESMACYRRVLDLYPSTTVGVRLKNLVTVRELEKKGRDLYRDQKFAEAAAVFSDVAKADERRRTLMDFYAALCSYGQGRGDEACARIRSLVDADADDGVCQQAKLWLAKFLFNRREWAESGQLFISFAGRQGDPESAAEALTWAARAAFAENDFNRAIQLSTQAVEKSPEAAVKPRALLVQGEALIELARFDEAVLVLERAAASETVSSEDRVRAQTLKADALYAMGADNPARYAAALEAYRAVSLGGRLSPSEQIVISFKIARVLEKLKRTEEAKDAYYAQVILAYLDSTAHLNDEARAAFSRAAFWMADEYESRGKDRQAVSILKLVVRADVPAAGEAARRIAKISNKGRVL